MQAFQVKCGRTILGASDRVPVEAIFGELGWNSVYEYYALSKLAFCNRALLLSPKRAIHQAMNHATTEPGIFTYTAISALSDETVAENIVTTRLAKDLVDTIRQHFLAKSKMQWRRKWPQILSREDDTYKRVLLRQHSQVQNLLSSRSWRPAGATPVINMGPSGLRKKLPDLQRKHGRKFRNFLYECKSLPRDENFENNVNDRVASSCRPIVTDKCKLA